MRDEQRRGRLLRRSIEATPISFMPGAGTDKTKDWTERAGPDHRAGRAAARREHRRRRPRDGQFRALAPAPRQAARRLAQYPGATRSASGADRILDAAALYDTVEAAIADCTLVLATTARAHDQAKPVIGPEAAATSVAPHVAAGENVAMLFGRERWGLENDEVALADRIVTFPVNPAFASLNLAQAVALVAYEWFKLATGGALPFAMPQKSEPAGKEQIAAFFANLERELDAIEYFRPIHKRATMLVNLRNIFARMQPTRQDIQTLHGVVMALVGGPQGARARRRARQRGGEIAARAARRIRRRPGPGRARPGARALAAPAPQSDRGRAHCCGTR